jgi:hypothetical protein
LCRNLVLNKLSFYIKFCATAFDVVVLVNTMNDELDEHIEFLINQYSIEKILSSICRICAKANLNYPTWGWKSDKNLIEGILPNIRN